MGSARGERRQDLTYGSDDQGSRERLRELILFVADRCQGHPNFGAVKLNKVLFYSDFISFAKYGEPITGASYKKLPLGPVPTAARAVRAEMEAGDELFVRHEGFPPYVQHRVIPRREANLDAFKARDIALVDTVIDWLSRYSASAVSEMSHDRAWQAAGDYETIPYEAALLSDTGPTEGDIARARELNARFGWEA